MLGLTGIVHKDKRVDRMLAAAGIAEARIFYSPIKSWVLLVLLFLSGSLLWIFFTTLYGLLLLPYFAMAYLINAPRNNSFALHGENLSVINSNAPFRKIMTFTKAEIRAISIVESKNDWRCLFLTLSSNYALIESHEGSFKYHCNALERDAFDENWTEETIDSFYQALLDHEYPATFITMPTHPE